MCTRFSICNTATMVPLPESDNPLDLFSPEEHLEALSSIFILRGGQICTL